MSAAVPTTPVRVGPEGSIAALSRVLDLRQEGPTTFTGLSLDQLNGRIYGGQVMAQAAIAAGRTLPALDERHLHSAHAYFLRPGRLDVPITFEVEQLHDGRSFSTRRAHAVQEGVPILALTASFQLEQSGLDVARTMPQAPNPRDLASSLDLFAGVDHPAGAFLATSSTSDVRHVEPPVYLQADPERKTTQRAWIRFREGLPDGLPSLVRRALLVQAVDQLALEPVLRATGLHWLRPGLSLATIDHTMHWHRDVDPTRWHLLEQRCISAHGGRGESSADIFDEDGRQVASFTQEGMVRVPEDD